MTSTRIFQPPEDRSVLLPMFKYLLSVSSFESVKSLYWMGLEGSGTCIVRCKYGNPVEYTNQR